MYKKKGRKYKEMEKRLQEYKLLESEIKKIKIDIDEIEKDIVGCKAITYSDDKVSDTYKFNSIVENESAKIRSRVDYLNKQIAQKQIEIDRIANAINLLDERERELFDLYFMSKSKRNMSYVAREMHLDRSTCYLVKDKIVFKMINFI